MCDKCVINVDKVRNSTNTFHCLTQSKDMGILNDLESGKTSLDVHQDYEKGHPLCRPVQVRLLMD
jgi:hypothetical protein